MDLSKVSFTSQYPIDRLLTYVNGTRTIPAYTAFTLFNVDNPIGRAFIPFIRYSTDGGNSWYENGMDVPEGSSTTGLAMVARCNDSVINIMYTNFAPSAKNALWEVYGVDINV